MRRVQSSMDLKDEIELHEKGWIIQRVGWVLLILMMIAASLGLFGNGILSHKYVAASTASVSYERFGRFDSPMEIKINAEAQGNLVLKIPQAYLRKMELDKIVPQPDEQKIENDTMIFKFDASDLAEVTVYLLPQTKGSLSTSLEVDGDVFAISHFIYP